jgi:hypothetical protein
VSVTGSSPVPLRRAVESLCRLAYSRLATARKLRDDVRRQIGQDVALVKETVAAISPKAANLGGLHDERFLEALRRLAGVVRMTAVTAPLEPGETEALTDLATIDALLRESEKDFPLPEKHRQRWRTT